MTNEDSTRWIVFNGEIYNHKALRNVLTARGHTFRTHSDTEVVLHAYEEYGPACVEHLVGMFAVAILDESTEELFLARDRLGKKPLFFAELGDTLLFASEIRALRRSPLWDDTLDPTQLEGYLLLGYVLAPHTIFKQVRKLEPGCWLRLSRGKIEIRRYWDIQQFDDDGRNPDQLDEHLGSLLDMAVTDRLESEVPLGAFLSGGIDSGLVVSYMADALTRPVITTSVGFGEAAHNELDAARLTAERYSTAHHAAILHPNLEEVFDSIIAGFDEPFADASAIPTYYVSRMARQRVTVALSGDGGDETFGGYGFRYIPHLVESIVRGLAPLWIRRRLFGALSSVWPSHRLVPRPLRLGTVLENLGRDNEAAYYADLCFMPHELATRLSGRGSSTDARDSAHYEAVVAPYRRCPSKSPVQRAQYADLKIYLPNDVLVKVDRMSMQHSLEVRCPLLDHRIVEAAFRIPATRKMPHLEPKALLRRLAATRLPPALLRLPKHGFTAPVGRWMADRFRGRVQDDLLGSDARVRHLLDPSTTRQVFDEHCTGRRDHSYSLWSLWVLENWLRIHN